jgi:hypothetical protein
MAKKQTVAKNAVPATVVPRRDRAKGNREERGGHQPPFVLIFQLSIQRKLK